MYSIVLVIIYLAFISLGLPDSLLGSGWPVMQADFDVPLSYAGILTMLISIFTVISSLFCSRITAKISYGLYTGISIALTAIAMILFAYAQSFWVLVVLTIPYGLGAGGVDAALNNYVSLHYKSRHMSWLHCFWGVGAIVSPYIMGASIGSTMGWQGGYLIVGIMQVVLAVVVLATIPLWKKSNKEQDSSAPIEHRPLTLKEIFSIKGVPLWVLGFFCYCALEQTVMIWAGTYLNQYKMLDDKTAAFFSSFVFVGLTVGRFLGGFVTEKLGDKRLIRLGYVVSAVGLALVAIPVDNAVPALVGLAIMGLGFAPIYPCIIHATPDNFGKENSQSIIGVQMAFAYLGVTFMPSLFGVIAENISLALLPLFVAVFLVALIVIVEVFYHRPKKCNLDS